MTRRLPDGGGVARRRDPLGAALGLGFVSLLLATETVLTLPDEAAVAALYAAHRMVIAVLQVRGFVAAGLLAGYAWRLRQVDRLVSATALVVALCGLLP